MFCPNWPIFVVDFEGSLASGVVEYGLVRIEKGQIVSTQTRFCRARAPIDVNEYRCHGIEFEETLSFLPFSYEREYFLKQRTFGPFGAHNSLFEDRLLRYEWANPGRVPRFLDVPTAFDGWGPWLDTYFLYKRCFPKLKQFALSDLIEIFGYRDLLDSLAKQYCPANRQKYHCALYDALACSLLLLHLIQHRDLQPISLEWLLIHSANGQRNFQNMNQQELF